MTGQRKVVVVGGGNAGLCAALSAREQGAAVTVLERAPQEAKGGNSTFTAGAMRVAYEGVEDLLTLMPDLDESQLAITDFGSYPKTAFLDDLARVTEYRTDPELASLLVDESLPTLQWMQGKGVRFLPIYGRQAFQVDGRFKFWGGLTVEVSGGGPGLVDSLTRAALAAGVEIRYGARAVSLLADDEGVQGVRIRQEGRTSDLAADAVVLASGGFQANAEMRARYLGPNWDLAKVRGTMYDTGDGIKMALDIGASPAGNWSGCHAVGWERNAPEFGDLAVGDHFQKHSYPWGVMVNAHGRRFVDEGADFRNYTYAKYGRVILAQPQQFAWQIFDAKVTHLLRDEYRIRRKSWRRSSTVWTPRRSARKSRPTTPPLTSRRRSTPTSRMDAGRSAWRCRRATGPTASTSRRSRPTRSRAESPSLLEVCASTPPHGCWTRTWSPSLASSRPASSSAASSTSTIPAAVA
jgi:tricarballylate dehydrogenase